MSIAKLIVVGLCLLLSGCAANDAGLRKESKRIQLATELLDCINPDPEGRSLDLAREQWCVIRERQICTQAGLETSCAEDILWSQLDKL